MVFILDCIIVLDSEVMVFNLLPLAVFRLVYCMSLSMEGSDLKKSIEQKKAFTNYLVKAS